MRQEFVIRMKREIQEVKEESPFNESLGVVSLYVDKLFIDDDNNFIFVEDFKTSNEEYLEAKEKGELSKEMDLSIIENYNEKYMYKTTDISFKDWSLVEFMDFSGDVYYINHNSFSKDEKDILEMRLCEEKQEYCVSYVHPTEKRYNIFFIPVETYEKYIKK
jgi:hypothetical protein